MNHALVADVLVNVFAATGAMVVASSIRRVDPRGALSVRVMFLLVLVCCLFLARSTEWLTGVASLDSLTTAIASLVPLASLLVAEGLLRRHAPWRMKAFIVTASLCLAAVGTLRILPDLWIDFLRLTHVAGGFAIGAFLLLSRDRTSLAQSENRLIRRVLVAVACLIPLILTDFRSIMPEVPIRLGAVGTLLVLYCGFGAGGLAATGRTRLSILVGLTLISMALAAGFVAADGRPDASRMVRVAAVAFSALLLAALVAEELGARADRSKPVSPLLSAGSVPEFEAALAGHPLLGDVGILSGPDLADVDDPAFRRLLSDRPLLRAAEAPWGRLPHDDGVERARSMMSSHDASHLMLLSHDPLRVAVFCLPAVASDPRTEGEIEVARRIGETLYSGVAS